MKIKQKKCIECKELFTPYLSTQKVCSTKCAVTHAKIKEQQKEKKEWQKEKKERKESLLTHSDHLNLLQKVFNQYIRLRDKNLPCISCGTVDKTKQYDAGHYRSVGANPELRFDENNVHKQCRKCNGYWGGNLIEYRKNLIVKIGIEEVERLESKNEPLKLSIPEIKEKIKYYRELIKQLN